MSDFHLSRINCALGRGCSARATEKRLFRHEGGLFCRRRRRCGVRFRLSSPPAISPCLCDSLALNLGGATIGNRPRLCTKPSNQTLKHSNNRYPPGQSTYCNIWIGDGLTLVWREGKIMRRLFNPHIAICGLGLVRRRARRFGGRLGRLAECRRRCRLGLRH